MSRGKKKASLHDLSFVVPTEGDQDQVTSELIEGSDKACALIAVAWLDRALIALLSTKMLGVDAAEHKPIFYGQAAILGSFSSKIRLCYVLSLVTKDQAKLLNTMREIRNHFAHSLLPSSFNQELVAKECDTLWVGKIPGKLSNLPLPRARFVTRWTLFAHELTDAYIGFLNKDDAFPKEHVSHIAEYIRSTPTSNDSSS